MRWATTQHGHQLRFIEAFAALHRVQITAFGPTQLCKRLREPGHAGLSLGIFFLEWR